MYLTVKVRESEAQELQQEERPSTPAATEVLRAAEELGATLRPMHPGVRDPELSTYFFVEVPDQPTAGRIISRLQNCDAVESAYVKPPDEMP